MVEATDLVGDVPRQLLLVLPKGAQVNERDQLNLWDAFLHDLVLVDNDLRAIIFAEGYHAIFGLPV